MKSVFRKYPWKNTSGRIYLYCGIFLQSGKKKNIEEVGFYLKLRYVSSLSVSGVHRTDHLCDAASPWPGTHHQLPAACCIDSAQQPLRAHELERYTSTWSMTRMVGVGVCPRVALRPGARRCALARLVSWRMRRSETATRYGACSGARRCGGVRALRAEVGGGSSIR